jgi:PKD repeat protein
MKINQLFICIAVTMACAIAGCKYPVVEDCDISALFDPIVLADDGTVKFTNVPNIQDATYEWDFGDGTRFSGRSPEDKTYTPKPTAYYIKLRISKGNDCFDEYLDSIFVINTVVAQFMANDTILEIPQLVTFTHNSIDADHYTWRFGDGSPDVVVTGNINKNVTHLYDKYGQFNVILEAKNSATGVISRDTLALTAKVPVFKKSFTLASPDISDPEKLWGIDQNSNGQIYLAVGSAKGCYMAKADKEMNILPESNMLYKLSGQGFGAIQINNYKKTSNGYLLLGQVEANNVFALYALRANNSFDFPENKSFNDQTTISSKYGMNATSTDDGNFMLCGASDGPGTSGGMYFVKVNKNTLDGIGSPNILFLNELGASATAILNVSDGYLVAGKKKRDSSLESCFFKVNDNLVEPNSASISWIGSTFEITDIIPVNDSKYALVGNDNGTARIMIMNAAGASTWDMTYSGFSLGQAIYMTDKRLIFAGTTNSGVKSAAWVELNAETGTLLSSVAHTVTGISDLEGNCITATSDGGFLIGANGGTWNVVIKTNEKGQTN